MILSPSGSASGHACVGSNPLPPNSDHTQFDRELAGIASSFPISNQHSAIFERTGDKQRHSRTGYVLKPLQPGQTPGKIHTPQGISRAMRRRTSSVETRRPPYSAMSLRAWLPPAGLRAWAKRVTAEARPPYSATRLRAWLPPARLRAWAKRVRAEARGSGKGNLHWGRQVLSAYIWCLLVASQNR